MAQTYLHVSMLRRAAHHLGGADALARELGVTDVRLGLWLQGRAPLPPEHFMHIAAILGRTAASEFWNDMFARGAGLQEMLDAALDAAIECAEAHFGSLQLLQPEGLRLRATRAFSRAMQEFYAVVAGEHCCCGVAMKRAERIVVTDIEKSAFFEQPGLGLLREVGIRSVQSTPVVAADGRLLGMVSTHDRRMRGVTRTQAEGLDRVAARLGRWLEARGEPRLAVI